MAIHFAIIVAVLIELLHVVLDAVGGAVRIVGAIDERILRIGLIAVNGQLASVHPIRPGDAKDAADALLRVGAYSGRIAARHCLAYAVEAQLRDGLVQQVP